MTILKNDPKKVGGGTCGGNSNANPEQSTSATGQVQNSPVAPQPTYSSPVSNVSNLSSIPAIRRIQNLDNHLLTRPTALRGGFKAETSKNIRRHKSHSQYNKAGSLNSDALRKRRSEDNAYSKNLPSCWDSLQPTSSAILNPPNEIPSVAAYSSTALTAPDNLDAQDQEDSNCNSEDEYEAKPQSESEASLSQDELKEREYRFERRMKNKGYDIKPMKEDGACLFRAVADQVYGDEEMHSVVRQHCMDYIAKNRDYFAEYITEDFTSYINRKRGESVHGNHIEIQAMSEMYNRTIQVFCYSPEPINTFHGTAQTETVNEPIRLSYHNSVHYNSIVDPNKATIGVGLGLPGHVPGLADKNLLKEASRQSEDLLIEQAMLEDKLRASDWEATDDALTEQVVRQSYMQWLQENERRPKRSPSPSTSSKAMSSSEKRYSPKRRSQSSLKSPSLLGDVLEGRIKSPNHSPKYFGSPLSRSRPCTPPEEKKNNYNGHSPSRKTASDFSALPPELFGLNGWEDSDGIMAQVLASSQQEYIDSLKKTKSDDKDS